MSSAGAGTALDRFRELSDSDDEIQAHGRYFSCTYLLDMIEHQARQGVDYFTIHAGVLREHLPYVRKRLIGIVSRGGSLLAKWMIHHGRQNPMYDLFEQICDVMR